MGAGWNKREFTEVDHWGQKDVRTQKEDSGRRQNGDQVIQDAHVTLSEENIQRDQRGTKN